MIKNKNIYPHLSREHLKIFRGNNNRRIYEWMKDYCAEYKREVQAGRKAEVPGDWNEDTPVEIYARAHGFKFRYAGKYVRAVSVVATRGEANGTGENIPDGDDD
jgi:hypothetical protein